LWFVDLVFGVLGASLALAYAHVVEKLPDLVEIFRIPFPFLYKLSGSFYSCVLFLLTPSISLSFSRLVCFLSSTFIVNVIWFRYPGLATLIPTFDGIRYNYSQRLVAASCCYSCLPKHFQPLPVFPKFLFNTAIDAFCSWPLVGR